MQRHTGEFRAAFEQFAADHPMVGDLRGDGFFYSLELVKDKETKATFAPDERDHLIKQVIVPRARELGVYMRVDDRAETAAQFSPPLVATRAELDEYSACSGRSSTRPGSARSSARKSSRDLARASNFGPDPPPARLQPIVESARVVHAVAPTSCRVVYSGSTGSPTRMTPGWTTSA